MASTLTPQQREAVLHDGHLLIVAGPGSGKTSTSVAKARRILKDPNRSLLMVTFTKEGAEEMRKRLLAALQAAGVAPPGDERLIVATFHSIAIRHLKRHGMHTRVLSPNQQGHLFREAMFASNVDKGDWGEVQKEFEKVMYSVDQERVDVQATTHQVVEHYRRLLAATGQVDLYTVMRDCALGADRGSLPPMPFTDMLVDEGQDTDELQRLWIFAHARFGTRVTIVGDDDQSVYEWRNALGYAGMRSFLDTFRAHRIELGDNFRCKEEILAPAATLIAHNDQRLGKKLVAKRGSGGAIFAYRGATSDDQNRTLAELVLAVPHRHTNAAILARTNRSLDMLEIVLRGHGIEYTRIGKSIWEQPVIAGYIGLLQTLLDGNPAGLLPALQMRDVSPNVRADLLARLGNDVSSFLDGDIPDLNTVDKTDKATLTDLAKSFAYWRRQLRGSAGRGGSVREVILEVADQYAGWSGNRQSRSLVELCSRILSDMRGTLSARLMLISRKERKAQASSIVLMTMHAAKGLEFETVHIVDANKNEDGSDVVRPEAERRLMYVALTRAKDLCVIWTSGEPHPTIAESQVAYCPSRDALAQMVNG